jgi:hypothetical protein
VNNGGSSKSLTSPSLITADPGGVTAQPRISCTGNFNAQNGISTINVNLGATTFSTTYTMNANPTVFSITCVARDNLGNTSPPASYVFQLSCPGAQKWQTLTKRCG